MNLYGWKLIKTTRGHAGLDIYDSNYDEYWTDPLFQEFRIVVPGKVDAVAIAKFTDANYRIDVGTELVPRDM